MKKIFCKKLFYLLSLTLLQASLDDINLYAGDELPTNSPANFSFEDFLKQLKTEDPDKNLDTSTTQDKTKDLKDSDNQGKRLEQEIINMLNQKINPLATDLSKIVTGPESKKALAEKKKQREQKEKEAARRIEQMKSKRPYSYSPSYRQSSGYGGRDWSPPKGRSGGYGGYGGYGSGGYGGYSGYNPSSSYWDKYKGDGALKSQDQDKAITTGKDGEKKKKGGYSGSEEDKDIKRSIASVDNLTNRIQAILSRENGKIGNKAAIKDLATGATLVELKNLFDTRQQELIKIPENPKDSARDEKSGRTTSNSRKTYRSHEYKIKNLAQEKGMWQKFAPQIVSAINSKYESEGNTEAQNAGRTLLGSLKTYGYISQIPSEVRQNGGKSAQEEAAKEPDPIKYWTQKINALISRYTKILIKDPKKDPAVKQNNDIYRKWATKRFFSQISTWLTNRESELNKISDANKRADAAKKIKDSEKEFWNEFIPMLIQAVTYSEKDETPDIFKGQADGKKLMEKLEDDEYVSEEALAKAQTDFEATLQKKIKPPAPGLNLDKTSDAGKIMINRVKKLRELFGNIQDPDVNAYK